MKTLLIIFISVLVSTIVNILIARKIQKNIVPQVEKTITIYKNFIERELSHDHTNCIRKIGDELDKQRKERGI